MERPQTYLAARLVEQPLEVLDAKVADTEVPDLARVHQLLHLPPGVHKVPVRVMLLQILRIRAGRPVHEVQVDVVGAQVLERALEGLRSALVPGVVELGGEPDFLARHARRPDALADLLLVAIGKGSVNVAVASPEGGLDGLLDLTGLGLPCSEADGGDLGARVELVGLAKGVVSIGWSVRGSCMWNCVPGGFGHCVDDVCHLQCASPAGAEKKGKDLLLFTTGCRKNAET